MLRRSLSSRRLQMEALEVRCNLSAMDPFAGALAAPAAAEIGQALTPAETPVSLNAFAGQTVRIRIEAFDAAGGAGRDLLLGGAGGDATDSHELGHALGFRHEHTTRSTFGGDDVIFGGLGNDGLSAEGADLAAPGDSAEGGTLIPVKVKHNV